NGKRKRGKNGIEVGAGRKAVSKLQRKIRDFWHRHPKGSPRDYVGHDTHTASITADSHVPNATYYGLAAGTANGGSPTARIAIYKACSEDGCSGSTILKAMGDTIEDGVDFISISIGSRSTFQPRHRHPKGSPRDYVGHDTHTASIAADSHVPNATYYGLAAGTANGGSPTARIAIYKACSEDGCSGSTILKAMGDTIEDGVDFISISIGSSSTFQPRFLQDPITIEAFHAMEKGVTGSAINFSNLNRSRTYPLVYGAEAATNFTSVSESRFEII
ncbi:Subtilisin-like protease SBT5.1, partial [Linum perenne]